MHKPGSSPFLESRIDWPAATASTQLAVGNYAVNNRDQYYQIAYILSRFLDRQTYEHTGLKKQEQEKERKYY